MRKPKKLTWKQQQQQRHEQETATEANERIMEEARQTIANECLKGLSPNIKSHTILFANRVLYLLERQVHRHIDCFAREHGKQVQAVLDIMDSQMIATATVLHYLQNCRDWAAAHPEHFNCEDKQAPPKRDR